MGRKSDVGWVAAGVASMPAIALLFGLWLGQAGAIDARDHTLKLERERLVLDQTQLNKERAQLDKERAELERQKATSN